MITEAAQHTPTLFRMIVSLIIVIALMGGLALILRKIRSLDLSGLSLSAAPDKRLHVVERLSLDTRRQLVIFSCDGEEHLLLLGSEGETLINSPSKPKKGSKA